MNTFEIVAALIVLLIAMLFVSRKRKQRSSCSSCSSKETLISESKATELVKPRPEIKAADKPVVKAEPVAVNPQITAAKVVAPPAKPQAKEAVASPAENNSSVLPQDSILRRHYFSHLCTMLEALVPPRPTESVLCRHYDMMIVSKIVQCLSDKNATEQLICEYEKLNA